MRRLEWVDSFLKCWFPFVGALAIATLIGFVYLIYILLRHYGVDTGL